LNRAPYFTSRTLLDLTELPAHRGPPTSRQGTLTIVGSSTYLGGVVVEVGEAKRVVEAATNPDPEVGLAAVAALRALLDVLEALQVDNARASGWSWRDIAGRLGVTKQAAHAKHGLRSQGP